MNLKSFQRISRLLAANASLTVTAVAVLTFFMPEIFNWVRGTTQTVILGIIMLTMGLTLTTEDFRIVARRPYDILIGACRSESKLCSSPKRSLELKAGADSTLKERSRLIKDENIYVFLGRSATSFHSRCFIIRDFLCLSLKLMLVIEI